MPYTAEISRADPSCFLLLIDQSGSMKDVVDPTGKKLLDKPIFVDGRTFTHSATGRSKAQGVADAVNRLLQNLVIKCAKSEGVRDYYHVGVMGYGGAGVEPALGGMLAGRDLVPISEVAHFPVRLEERTRQVDDGAGGFAEVKSRVPIWIDPCAEGGTPMCEAMRHARQILSAWAVEHQDSFPPIVINITDGEAADGDATVVADLAGDLQCIRTMDGDTLFFNVHISSDPAMPVEFPDDEKMLPDEHARLLFRISSLLPPHLRQAAQNEGLLVTENSRGFAFNADMVSVIRFLDIGTRPANFT